MAVEQTVKVLLLKLRFFRPPYLLVTSFLSLIALCAGISIDLFLGSKFGYLLFIPTTFFSSWYAIFRQKSQNIDDLLVQAHTLNKYLNQEKILDSITQLLVPKMADWVIIYALSEEGHLTQTKSYHVLNSKKLVLDQFQLGNSHPIFQVIAQQKGALLNQDKNSILMIPLFLEKQLLAVLMLGMSDSGRVYKHADLQVLEQFADIAVWALQNANLYAQAQEEIKMRDEHLSLASHELKTPLTLTLLKLHNVLQNIRQQPLATFSVEKMMEMLESAQQQTTRLTNLIKDLMDLSAASTGRLSLTLEEMELSNVVQDMVIRFEEQLKEAGCQIAVITDPVVLGKWDPLRMEQVVANLLSNAIKYGKGKPIEVSLEKDGAKSRLKIKDQGIGMTPEQQAVIFKRFKRVVNNPEYKGLGVGLYITKQIVEAHGGTIQVESQPNIGSTFIVELPLSNTPSLKPKETLRPQRFVN